MNTIPTKDTNEEYNSTFISSNYTLDTGRHDSALSPMMGKIIIALTTIPLSIIFLFLVTGLINAKKHLRHLLVMSLCLVDEVKLITFCLFAFIKMRPEIDGNRSICLLNLLLMTFGIYAQCTVILFISMESYITIKSRNFGMRQKLDKMKYKLVIGAWLTCVMLAVLTIFPVPQMESIPSCSAPDLYGSNYKVLALIVAFVLTILLFLLIIISSMTSQLIWKIFFKEKQIPANVTRNTVQKSQRIEVSVSTVGSLKNETTNQDKKIPKRHQENVPSKDQVISLGSIQIGRNGKKFSTLNKVGTKHTTLSGSIYGNTTEFTDIENPKCYFGKKGELRKSKVSTDRAELSFDVLCVETEESIDEPMFENTFNCWQREVTKSVLNTKEKNINLSGKDCNGEAPECSRENKKCQVGQRKLTKKQEVKWETRALITNVIIASKAILLTAPFIASFWYDIFSDSLTSLQARFLIFLLCNIDSIINMCIFVWRIPEIHRPLRKCIKCC